MNASTTSAALATVRIATGMGIFAGGWYLTSGFENPAVIIAMGIATAVVIGIAHGLSLMIEPTEKDTAQTSFPVPTESDLHPVLAILRRKGSVASNAELAKLLKVSPGQASKLHQQVSAFLRYEKRGKQVRISLA
jgi:hypothetical protein